MINFYDVDHDYVNFLKSVDRRVPNIKYDTNDKFVCGVVLLINGIKYYAPISHMVIRQRTNMIIYDKQQPISSIRFSFMIPATDAVITRKNFNEIAKIDSKYADLLRTEFDYCKSHYNQIQKKAMSVYRIGCNKQHVLNNVCCDFRKLEEYYMKYFT